MAKIKLTKEQRQELFENNFSQKAYEKVKHSVETAISHSTTFKMLWEALGRYDRDVEYDDDFTIIYCGIELDRSNMQTKANYAGVRFTILWNDNIPKKSGILVAELYSSDTSSGEIEPICFFDPNTLEIVKWNETFHIDEKQ